MRYVLGRATMELEVIEMPEANAALNSLGRNQVRIVVGVDGSECGDRALEIAAHEAERWGAFPSDRSRNRPVPS